MKAGSLRTRSGYRWLICAAGTMVVFCSVGLVINAFSIYLPYIRELNGFTATQTNLLLTMRTLSQMCGLLCMNLYYRKFSFRTGSALALAVMVLGFFLYGLANSYAVYCAGAIICGVACGLSSAVGNMVINEWFVKDKALATSICAAGSGLASIIMPIVITSMVETFSIRAAFWLESAFILLIAVFALLTLHSNPNAAIDAPPADTPKQRQANFRIPRPNTLLLAVGIFLFGLAIYGVMGVLAQLLREVYTANITSYLVTAYGFTSFAGKLIYGRLADRIGLYLANLIALSALVLGTLGIFLFYRNLVLLILSIIVIGLGIPLATVTAPLMAVRVCNPGRYMNVVKVFSLIMTFGGFVVSYITGFFADLTGSNRLLFLILSAMALISTLLVQFSSRKALSE